MVYHSQGSVSIESKQSEQKPLLTELEDASAPHVQVNNTANIVLAHICKCCIFPLCKLTGTEIHTWLSVVPTEGFATHQKKCTRFRNSEISREISGFPLGFQDFT